MSSNNLLGFSLVLNNSTDGDRGYIQYCGGISENGKVEGTLVRNQILGSIATLAAAITTYNSAVVIETAKIVAARITNVVAPAKDATRLILPVVPGGYTIAIKSSDTPGVVGTNGTIMPPTKDVKVALVFAVKNAVLGTTADTKIINVIVPANTSIESMSNLIEVYAIDGKLGDETVARLTHDLSLISFEELPTRTSKSPASQFQEPSISLKKEKEVLSRVNSTILIAPALVPVLVMFNKTLKSTSLSLSFRILFIFKSL